MRSESTSAVTDDETLVSASRAVMLILVAWLSSCGGSEFGPNGPASRSCSGASQDRAAEVLEELGVSGTSTFFPRREVQNQYHRYRGSLCPDDAVREAIEAILTDLGPEALGSVAAELAPSDCDAQCYFRRESSLFGIVADSQSPIANQFLPAAPGGGSLRYHWVFFLSVPGLSEHGYWALVARDGSSVRVRSVN